MDCSWRDLRSVGCYLPDPDETQTTTKHLFFTERYFIKWGRIVKWLFCDSDSQNKQQMTLQMMLHKITPNPSTTVGPRTYGYQVIGTRGQPIAIMLLNGCSIKLSPNNIMLYNRLTFLLFLLLEKSICIKWWLEQRPTMDKGAGNTRL